MKNSSKYFDGLASVVNHSVGALMLFMSLAVFVSVVGRATANVSYDWLEELCRYIHILIVMLGVGLVTYRGEQIVMDLVFKSIKGKANIMLDLFNHICLFIFLCLGFYWGTKRVMSLFAYGGKTSSKVFYSWQPATSVPLGFLIGAVLTLGVIVRLYFSLRENTHGPEDGEKGGDEICG